MDILEIIREQVSTLPDGPHLVGLKSVLRHVDVAHQHFARGQEQADSSAFTDAIYRTNQAFEGSIKEAYRVLADKDPQKTTPYYIEKHLQKNNVFRPRVLSQFTNYRTEWRNPSTHDYNLDFDVNEAFLAIVSVSAFAKLLIDQIAEKLAYNAVKDEIEQHPETAPSNILTDRSLIDAVAQTLLEFSTTGTRWFAQNLTEPQLLGAITAFVNSADPNIKVFAGMTNIDNQRLLRGDLTFARGEESIVLEVKRGSNPALRDHGLQRLEAYLENSDVSAGILLIYSGINPYYRVEDIHISTKPVKIIASSR